jgi:phosphatidylinositol glycan class B
MRQLLQWPLWRIALLGFALYALTAWFSAGYHHPDEHFQLLEFARYMLGRCPAAALPWEFGAKIRPGLQPLLAAQAMRLSETCQLHDPFAQAFLLRLLSAVLSIGCLWGWARYLQDRYPGQALGQRLLWLGGLLWFAPYLGVRFSSENWSALSFAAGLLCLLQGLDRQRLVLLFTAGLLLALSFFFRFQMAFALLGLGGWLLWQGALRLRGWLALCAGALPALALGLWADQRLYGSWEPVALHYFWSNIVENKAAHWGTSPWWYYLPTFLLQAGPPLSLLLLLALGFALRAYHRSSPLPWVLLLFLLGHSLVGHKEFRFLFPMLLPMLVLVAQGWPLVRDFWGKKRWFRWVLAGSVVLNLVALPLRCLLPAQEAMPVLRYLHAQAQVHPQRPVWAVERDPFELVGLDAGFYRPAHMPLRVLPNLAALDSLPKVEGLLVYPKSRLQGQPAARRVYSNFPDWVLRFNPNDWQGRSRIWSVYQLNN